MPRRRPSPVPEVAADVLEPRRLLSAVTLRAGDGADRTVTLEAGVTDLTLRGGRRDGAFGATTIVASATDRLTVRTSHGARLADLTVLPGNDLRLRGVTADSLNVTDAGAADVWVVRADAGVLSVAGGGGEGAGRLRVAKSAVAGDAAADFGPGGADVAVNRTTVGGDLALTAAGDARFLVRDADVGGAASVVTGAGRDAVRVLDSSAGALSVATGARADRVTLKRTAAAAADLAGGNGGDVLRVFGGDFADGLTVEADGGADDVRVRNAAADVLGVAGGGGADRVRLAGVAAESVVADLGAGGDVLALGDAGAVADLLFEGDPGDFAGDRLRAAGDAAEGLLDDARAALRDALGDLGDDLEDLADDARDFFDRLF